MENVVMQVQTGLNPGGISYVSRCSTGASRRHRLEPFCVAATRSSFLTTDNFLWDRDGG